MTPYDVVKAFWDRIDARDWQGVRALLADDIVVDWPASLERMSGADTVVALNSEYAEGWTIRILRIVADGSSVVSEVEVPMDGSATSRVASFWEVLDGLIVRGVEYWIELGQDERPAWRASMTEIVPAD